MSTEIKVPTFPESVADGLIAAWHHQPGEFISRDELLVEIETDKVVMEVTAPHDGILKESLKKEGETVLSDEVIAVLEISAAPVAAAPGRETPETQDTATPSSGPAARKMATEAGIEIGTVQGSGKGGRVTKGDIAKARGTMDAGTVATKPPTKDPQTKDMVPAARGLAFDEGVRPERRVPMSRLRARIAERLVEAQRNAAMLTTFNEANMSAVMKLRQKYKEAFEREHDGVRLGFMSFFVRAAVEALKKFPAVNASIDGNDILYHGYYDIGVAVSTERGLVTPVLRNAGHMSMAQIEQGIQEYGIAAGENRLRIEDMLGGTFTISNGGVFGSLLSTPILNPPQTAILGMHKIQQRPVAVTGEIRIEPMMYLALSYDHRLIDGREAVQFLVVIKELIEDPTRMLLEI